MKCTAALIVISVVFLPAVLGAQETTPKDTVAKDTVVSVGERGTNGNGLTASAEACTKIRAYVKQVVGDSINVLHKNGKLQQAIDSVQRTGQLNIDLSNVPDSIQLSYLAAGQSCELIDLAMIMKLLRPVPADTASKPPQP